MSRPARPSARSIARAVSRFTDPRVCVPSTDEERALADRATANGTTVSAEWSRAWHGAVLLVLGDDRPPGPLHGDAMFYAARREVRVDLGGDEPTRGQRSAAAAARRHAAATPGVRHPLIRAAAQTLDQVPDARAAVDASLLAVERALLLNAMEREIVAQLAREPTARRHLAILANAQATHTPVPGTTRKWLHDWRRTHAVERTRWREVKEA